VIAESSQFTQPSKATIFKKGIRIGTETTTTESKTESIHQENRISFFGVFQVFRKSIKTKKNGKMKDIWSF
jgi:hypothetical protein